MKKYSELVDKWEQEGIYEKKIFEIGEKYLPKLKKLWIKKSKILNLTKKLDKNLEG